MSPAEFWRLPPGELWWVVDARLPPEIQNRKPAQNDRLLSMLEKAIEEAET
ncbi:hypothetical protein [Defluviimonas sp. D31]|uniref:hypothetical protein n=1 Tax=Defluviimonas sp. D31 TaxID=3083253 RepID=UPI00296FAC4A|nr:hypothetical protein [Defluviimonas sp. D31]